jgi:uncharacterized RDD family membrane protein YckC
MTNTGGTPAGWYHAPGDPEDTQRYWDGAQWIGEPQIVRQAPQAPQEPQAPDTDQTVAYTPPQQASPPPGDYQAPGAAQPPAGQPPAYGGAPAGAPPAYGGAPGAPAGAGAPPAYGAPGAPGGYQAFGSVAAGTPAEFGPRAIAYLIDLAPIIVGYIIVAFVGLISDVLGALVGLVFWVAAMGYSIWNFYIVQGKTGQTIGKEKQGIKLVLDQTGAPVGGGMAFVRYLCSGAFILACCIGYPINMLSPLWNPDKKTYSDKIMKMSVVTTD